MLLIVVHPSLLPKYFTIFTSWQTSIPPKPCLIAWTLTMTKKIEGKNIWSRALGVTTRKYQNRNHITSLPVGNQTGANEG